VVSLGPWWIISQTLQNNSSGNTTLYVRFTPDATGGLASADAYDLQMITGVNASFLTTMIDAANYTRNADQVSSVLASSGLASTGPYTFYSDWGPVQKPLTTGRHYLMDVDDGTANNRISLFIDQNGYVNCEVVTGGVQQAIITGAADRSAGGKAGCAINTNDMQLAVNGVSIGTALSLTLPTGLTTWRHGSDQSGANQLDGPILREAAWRSRQPSPFLQTASQYPPYEPYASILTHWFGGGVSGKTIVFTGDSTTSNATTMLGTCAQPGPCNNSTSYLYTYFQQTGEPLAGTTILNYGNNGSTLAAWLADSPTYGYSATVAANPNLIVFCFGINDVRLGLTNLPSLIALIQQAVNQLRAALPSTDIVLWGPNEFLTTDVGGLGFVSPNSAAQAYSTELFQAYAAVVSQWQNVAVVQKQNLIAFPQTSPALSAYMANQIHPSSLGQIEESVQINNAVGSFP
jgi:lysophospholipase L1-like esterase